MPRVVPAVPAVPSVPSVPAVPAVPAVPVVPSVVVVVAVALVAGAGGCASTAGEWSVGRLLGWEEVKVPRDMTLPRAHLEMAERVETLGRRILAQNPFTGIEPMFYAIGVPEPVLFHRGPEELFISEGLVRRCPTEAELAAVLCAELGQMVVEKRAGRRAGFDRETIPEVALPGGTMLGGGTAADPGRAAELAFQERRRDAKLPAAAEPADAKKVARELLTGAGFDPAELDRVEPLLRPSDRGALLRKQMSGPAPAPKWER